MRFRKYQLIFFYCLVLFQISFSEEKKFAKNRSVDILHYKLNLKIDPKENYIDGTCEIKFVPLKNNFQYLELNQYHLNFTSVKIGETNLRFYKQKNLITIPMDKNYSLRDTLNIEISYNVKPKKGLYFIAPNDSDNNNYQVWTQGQAEENNGWFPCYDYPNDKSTNEIIVTVDENLTAISNGKLLSEKNNNDGTKTFHYYQSIPHSLYLISLIVGKYEKLTDDFDDIPIEYYVPSNKKDIAHFSFSNTKPMMEFFSEKIKFKYPWEKYAQTTVRNFSYGGMENTSATTLTDLTLHDEKSHLDNTSDGLVAHELAHQWWGNVVTPRDWSHSWLSEGFASYFENLWSEKNLGEDQFVWNMISDKINGMNADVNNKRPIVWNEYEYPDDIFDGHIYAKGSAVLHMLHIVLGDELFWKTINHYIIKHQFQNVETNDFKIAIEEATGLNLNWFFDEWLYSAGYPVFQIDWNYSSNENNVKLSVKQTQEYDEHVPEVFKMSVNIEFFVDTGSVVKQILVDKKEQTFEFEFNEKPIAIVFDKGSHIIKRMSFNRTIDELLYILENGDIAAKLEVISDLKTKIEDDERYKISEKLFELLEKENFWGLRKNAIELLFAFNDEEIENQLIKYLNDKNVKIEIALIKGFKNSQNKNAIPHIKYLFENGTSYEVIANALEALLNMDSENKNSYVEKSLQMDSHNEIIRFTTLSFLSTKREKEILNQIQSFTQNKYNSSIRNRAIGIYVSSTKNENIIVNFLLPFVSDNSFQVRRNAISVLSNYSRKNVVEAFQKQLPNEHEVRLRQTLQNAIESINKELSLLEQK